MSSLALEVYEQVNTADSDIFHLKDHTLMANCCCKHFCRRMSQEAGGNRQSYQHYSSTTVQKLQPLYYSKALRL